jgi:hypothetical protein
MGLSGWPNSKTYSRYIAEKRRQKKQTRTVGHPYTNTSVHRPRPPGCGDLQPGTSVMVLCLGISGRIRPNAFVIGGLWIVHISLRRCPRHKEANFNSILDMNVMKQDKKQPVGITSPSLFVVDKFAYLSCAECFAQHERTCAPQHQRCVSAIGPTGTKQTLP